MKTATEIIDSLGGLSECARVCDLRPSAISSWKDQNSIPRWHHDALIKLAKKKDVDLSKDDFPTKQSAKQAA